MLRSILLISKGRLNSVFECGFSVNSCRSWNTLRYCVNLSLVMPRWDERHTSQVLT